MFTLDLICMRYLCISVIHQTMIGTTGSLTCLHDLLMHASTYVFAFIYSVRLNGCLFFLSFFFFGGGEAWVPLFFIQEGPLAPFSEILEATLRQMENFNCSAVSRKQLTGAKGDNHEL